QHATCDFGQHRQVDKACRLAFAPEGNIAAAVGTEKEAQLAFRHFAPNVMILPGGADFFVNDSLRVKVAGAFMVRQTTLDSLFRKGARLVDFLLSHTRAYPAVAHRSHCSFSYRNVEIELG